MPWGEFVADKRPEGKHRGRPPNPNAPAGATFDVRLLSQPAAPSAINAAVQTGAIENILRDLPHRGTLVADTGRRQTWRFEMQGRPYYLRFYPLRRWRERMARAVRGSPAMSEFARLQWLQKASVPAPRAIACLLGMRVGGIRGDAVVIEGLEPSQALDRYLHAHGAADARSGRRRALAKCLTEILVAMGRAGLGHDRLGPDSFLVHRGGVYLLDACGVHKGGLRMNEVERLGVLSRPYASRAELLRVWRALELPGVPSANPRQHRRLWERVLANMFADDRYFRRVSAGAWSGWCFLRTALPREWSDASRLDVPARDWERVAREILADLSADTMEILKRSSSGDVLATRIVLGGRPLDVIVKHPRRKFWYRHLTEIWRGTRARRAWNRAWQLIIRGIPTAWPLLMLEKRVCGYVTDGIVVFERIPGRALSETRYWKEDPDRYRTLLLRCGRMLRRMEESGLYFYDSKTTNWVVREYEGNDPLPLLVDVEGVRIFNQGGGVRRLLRSLRESPDGEFEPADGAALLRGYFPFAAASQIERMLAETHAAPRRRTPLPQQEAGV